MNISRLILEKQAGLRYHRARAVGYLTRSAYGHLGHGTVVMQPLMLKGIDRVSLGDGILVRDGAWIAAEGDSASIAVGEGTYIGHRVHLHSIDPLAIGRRCVLADNVMVTTTDHDRARRLEVHGTGPIVIGDDVFIGQNVVVLGGVRIGDRATIAAGAVVVSDVAPHSVVGGVPARVIGGGA